MKDAGYLKKHVYQLEIDAPVSLLKQLVCAASAMPVSANIELPKTGTVAVLLPFSGINTLLAKAVCASFLSGYNTVVRLPDGLPRVTLLLRELINAWMPEVSLAPETQSAATFLLHCAAAPEIHTVVVYANDHWIQPFRNIVRRTGTRLFFEGPGKNPQIVLEDAGIDLAVAHAVQYGLLNGGQSRFATERYFVHRNIYSQFVQELTDRLHEVKIGMPDDEMADIGPVCSDAILNRMIGQVIDARHQGADILTGGKPLEIDSTGKLYFPPTIVTNCTPAMQMVQDENFGTLFPIIPFSTEEELLLLADQSDYGLTASIYGNPATSLTGFLQKNHCHLFCNSNVNSPQNLALQLTDGGFRNSGFVWEWKQEHFLHREGSRILLNELSITVT